MKNKFSIVILILYSVLLIILSINSDKVNGFTLSLAAMISKNNYYLIYDILHYTELVIFYGGFAITITVVCIEYFDTFKYILIYSVLLNMFAIVIVLVIKSFTKDFNYIDLLVSIIIVLLGIGLEILVKIRQIKGEKDEK